MSIPFDDLRIPILPSNVAYFPHVTLQIDLELEDWKSEAYRNLIQRGNYVIILCEAEKDHDKNVFSYSLKDKEIKLYNIGTMAQILAVEIKADVVKLEVRGFDKCRVAKYFKPTDDMPVALAKDGEILKYHLQETAKSEKLVRNFISWVCYGQVNDEFAELALQVSDKLLEVQNAKTMHEADLSTNNQHYSSALQKLIYYLATFYITPHTPTGVTKAILRAETMERELEMINFQFKKLFKINTSDKSEADKEDENANSHHARYEKIKEKLNEEVQTEVERALKYLEDPGHNSEAKVVETWLGNTLNLPWGILTPEEEDFEKAEKILEESHYGLQKAKGTILDILATQKAKKEENPNAPVKTVLCFVGQSGVGKTSLGQSIARAMGRKFIRESLGGIRDEADIRGHRRTYIGALPGKIMEGLRKAKACNPVFMIDEIDKLGADFRGDPSAALMEVFDPEQNHNFRDHYYGFPFDLSQILFICTANIIDKIPGPLQDRMEIIKLSGYFEHEKIDIAQKHLMPRQVKDQGLASKIQFDITEETLQTIISEYTFEAGVRGLENHIKSILRRINRQRAKGQETRESVSIAVNDLESYLGRPRAKYKKAYITEAGEGMGLSVMTNDNGVSLGEILPIQCLILPDADVRAKTISYTGNFQEVMRESIKNAVTCARVFFHTHYPDMPNPFNGKTIDVGSQSAADRKDGPSAGGIIELAIISAVLQKPLKPFLAMTGELDKYARIKAIGGVKDKILGAERAGIKEVILPLDNKEDFDELPGKIKAKIKVHFVQTLEEAIPIAFEGGLPLKTVKAM